MEPREESKQFSSAQKKRIPSSESFAEIEEEEEEIETFEDDDEYTDREQEVSKTRNTPADHRKSKTLKWSEHKRIQKDNFINESQGGFEPLPKQRIQKQSTMWGQNPLENAEETSTEAISSMLSRMPTKNLRNAGLAIINTNTTPLQNNSSNEKGDSHDSNNSRVLHKQNSGLISSLKNDRAKLSKMQTTIPGNDLSQIEERDKSLEADAPPYTKKKFISNRDSILDVK